MVILIVFNLFTLNKASDAGSRHSDFNESAPSEAMHSCRSSLCADGAIPESDIDHNQSLNDTTRPMTHHHVAGSSAWMGIVGAPYNENEIRSGIHKPTAFEVLCELVSEFKMLCFTLCPVFAFKLQIMNTERKEKAARRQMENEWASRVTELCQIGKQQSLLQVSELKERAQRAVIEEEWHRDTVRQHTVRGINWTMEIWQREEDSARDLTESLWTAGVRRIGDFRYLETVQRTLAEVEAARRDSQSQLNETLDQVALLNVSLEQLQEDSVAREHAFNQQQHRLNTTEERLSALGVVAAEDGAVKERYILMMVVGLITGLGLLVIVVAGPLWFYRLKKKRGIKNKEDLDRQTKDLETDCTDNV